MKIRYAKKSEKEIAIKFWKDSFKDSEEQIKFYFDNIYNEKNYLVLEDNSKIVSSLHENDYIFNFNNESIKSKYIVGVSSDITMRNKGYMSKLLITMLENSKKKDIPFVFLTPINPKIYRKFGYEYFSNIEYYNFSVEELANFKLPNNEYSYIEINEKNKNLYLNDLIKIYNTNMRDNFSYLERNDFYFDKILKEAISDEMKAFILYKNKVASAYIIFGLYEKNIEIRECMALDAISYKEILALIYGYRDYYKNVSLASPNNSSIEFLFENQLNIEKFIKPFMMMRVLNPLAIFKNLKLENSNIKIYRKFGFEYFSNIEYYNFSIEELANFKLPSNNYSYIEINNEENKKLYLKDLIKVYNSNMEDKFCYLERDDFYFDKILKEAISDEMKIFILYKNKVASAYIIFGLYEENIEIRECMALDVISYKEILALIYGYRDYYKNVSLASPNNSSLEFLFENQLNIEKIVKPFMMLRVLNPLAIFKNLKLENHNIYIYIEDKILKENTGLYCLDKEIKFSNITEEKASYDLKIDIGELVFLITGYFSIDDLVKLGKIDIKNKNVIKKLNKIFNKRNSYLYEFI